MRDLLTRLTILTEASSVFADKSDALMDFGNDTESVTLTTADKLYIGYQKMIRSVFFLINTPSTGSRKIKVEFFDGSSWVEAYSVDDTKGFTRSGFISWDLPLDDAEKVTVNSEELWWVRLSVTVNTSAVALQAVSGVFSDDAELKKEFPRIMDTGFLLGQTSHALIHEATRDEIVQKFRNKGVRSKFADKYRRLTFWDLMDFQELKQGATLLALSKILSNVADSGKGDNWGAKSSMFAKKADLALDLAFTTYDRWGESDEDVASDTTVVYLRR